MKKFVEIYSYGGIDWHDSASTRKFLMENGRYEITDEISVITNFVKGVLDQMLKDREERQKVDVQPASEDEIREILLSKSCKTILAFNVDRGVCDNGEPYEIAETELVLDGEKMTISVAYAYGQVNYTDHIYVTEIPDEDVRYMVMENFPCPNKGVPAIERFYSLPVRTQEEAEKLLADLKLHDKSDDVWVKSVKELIICDINEITAYPFWAYNIIAMDEEKALRKMIEDDHLDIEIPFKMNAAVHVEALKEANQKAWKMKMEKLDKKFEQEPVVVKGSFDE